MRTWSHIPRLSTSSTITRALSHAAHGRALILACMPHVHASCQWLMCMRHVHDSLVCLAPLSPLPTETLLPDRGLRTSAFTPSQPGRGRCLPNPEAHGEDDATAEDGDTEDGDEGGGKDEEEWTEHKAKSGRLFWCARLRWGLMSPDAPSTSHEGLLIALSNERPVTDWQAQQEDGQVNVE